ncbi:MAG: nuclear transport factor 2 family protein [Deltaproteobacteria bacterium]|nr:nuclear transport factor 2 family protein [Deltaproteobacteria bacterium]MBW2445208.1 nuclear transport factor 2 family protein [Deltaproteobacteria bacterium]
MADEPAAVVQRYFDRMRSRDPSVVDLFHDDASLIGLGSVRSGKDAIREFYEGSIRGASPTPTLIGEILAAGDRVAAEVTIELSNGALIHAVDIFVVEQGRIRTLTYFLADH